MGGSLSYQGIRAVLLDIEGTTTPVDFVHQVLFPYARTNLKVFLEKHPDSAFAELELLRTEYERDRARGLEPPPWEPVGPVSYAHWLMDQDRKSTGLKSLQGKIWELGYQAGELRGEVYPDVPVAFERWRKQGMRICIYSSGSVLAQKLLFAHSTAGDLTRFLDAHFDTSTGGKMERESYSKIAAALSLAPSTILFLSDVAAELDAAFEAGMKTGLCRRNGTDEPERTDHPIIRTLVEVAT
jgi:enolase-phosphatase E1